MGESTTNLHCYVPHTTYAALLILQGLVHGFVVGLGQAKTFLGGVRGGGNDNQLNLPIFFHPHLYPPPSRGRK